ncbi:MAG: hypothetical protein ACOVMQ_09360 [Cyclobacteriaceae bacterium]
MKDCNGNPDDEYRDWSGKPDPSLPAGAIAQAGNEGHAQEKKFIF